MEPAGELVNNDHLSIPDHVLLVTGFHYLGAQGVFHVVDQVEIFRLIKVGGVGPLLHLGNAVLGQRNGLGAVIDGVVLFGLQPGHQLGESLVVLDRFRGRPADDQRCPGLVDQDVVHFVHDGEIQFPLHTLRGLEGHIVPKVIKTKFVVGPVGDVRLVGLRTADPSQELEPVGWVCEFRIVDVRGVVLEARHGQAQSVVDRPHPHRIPPRQVVVHRHYVDTVAG